MRTPGFYSAAFTSTLLALTVSACAPEPQQIPEFETVTVNLPEPASQLGGKPPGVPLPARKPALSAAEKISAAVTAFLPRMPNLRQLSACEGDACKRPAN